MDNKSTKKRREKQQTIMKDKKEYGCPDCPHPVHREPMKQVVKEISRRFGRAIKKLGEPMKWETDLEYSFPPKLTEEEKQTIRNNVKTLLLSQKAELEKSIRKEWLEVGDKMVLGVIETHKQEKAELIEKIEGKNYEYFKKQDIIDLI